MWCNHRAVLKLWRCSETPRKLRIKGLRGDAGLANGIYVADGLRTQFGRPLYRQVPDSADPDLALLYYLYPLQHNIQQHYTEAIRIEPFITSSPEQVF